MKIYIYGNKYAQQISLGEEFRYLGSYLSDFFTENQLFNSLEEIEIRFAFSRTDELSEDWKIKEKEWLEGYLPYIRFTKNRSVVAVTKRFFGKVGDQQISFENVFFELGELFKLLETKKKPQDDFQTEKILSLLPKMEQYYRDNLLKINQKYTEYYRQLAINKAHLDREERQQTTAPAKRLIRDIRLMYHFENKDIPQRLYFSPFNIDLCDKILLKLREKKFRLPNYDHLYISVAENFDNALQHAVRAERWFVYGIAVLENPEKYANKSKEEQKQIVFNLIKTGLLDIAQIDDLDIKTLMEVLDEVEKELN